MSSPQSPTLSPELTRGVTAVARTLVAASRNWSLYPHDHPAVRASVQRLTDAVQHATSGAIFAIGVTPDALLIENVPLQPSPPVSEAAKLLHDRDILEITFAGAVTPDALHQFLTLLARDTAEVRARGGPAAVWAEMSTGAIAIEQIDYQKVLADHERKIERREDDLWKSIVKSIIEGKRTFDEQAQRRLLEIAGDPAEIGHLASAVMAPKYTADGAPMITTQAVTVLAAFRHMANIVNVIAPDRLPDVMRNLATASAGLNPHVVMQVLKSSDEPEEGVAVVSGMSAAFDDYKVAQLLATALALDGRATGRLADVFNTIAPDAERKQRVLTLTRTLLSEMDFGRSGQFQAVWASMEELLLSYDDSPFVSESYKTSLNGAGRRAERMAAADLPEELEEWMLTLGQDNVRHLSVTMLLDLFRLERDPGRAGEIARDMGALAEDLLLAGDYTGTLTLTRTLKQAGDDDKNPAREGARSALDSLAHSDAMRETVAVLGDVDDAAYDRLAAIAATVGAAMVDLLRGAFQSEGESIRRKRAAEIVGGFGAPAVGRLAALADDTRWFVQRNLAELLGRLAKPEGVPLLQTMLRRGDARVVGPVIAALAGINDPGAARAIQTVLRAATGEARRAVISALVAERDPRVIPMLLRILNESEPLGKDHTVVLDTLGALSVVGTDQVVPPVATLMRRRSWLARAKVRALKQSAVATLIRINSPSAVQALDDAGTRGDRLLRKIVRQARGTGTRH